MIKISVTMNVRSARPVIGPPRESLTFYYLKGDVNLSAWKYPSSAVVAIVLLDPQDSSARFVPKH